MMIYNAAPIFSCQVSLCFVPGSVLCKKNHKNILQCFVLKQRHFLLFFSPYILPTWLFLTIYTLYGKKKLAVEVLVKVQPVDFSVLGISAQLNDTNKSPFLLQTCLV